MAAANKTVLTGAELINLLSCEPEVFTVNNITVELRALSFNEVQRIANQHRENATEMAFQALRLGLVTPQLSDEQFEQLRAGKSGPLMKMATRVMEISGMTEGERPLGGSGS